MFDFSLFFFVKQKTAYDVRISDWSSDVCSSDLTARLGLAVQLRFFAGHGFFVPDHASIPSDGVLYLAEQLGLDAKSVNHYDFSGRTARRHCAEILRHLGFRRMTQTDRRALSRWISDDLCAGGQP